MGWVLGGTHLMGITRTMDKSHDIRRRWCGVACAALCLACEGSAVGPGQTTGTTSGGSGNAGAPQVPDTQLAPSDVSDIAATCDAKAPPSAAFAPLARLTRREYVRTLRDLLGIDFPIANLHPDGIVGLFFANTSTPVSETQVDDYRLAAEQVAQGASLDAAAVAGCDPTQGEGCVRSFIESFGRRAFRRPLKLEEVDAYLAIYRVGIGRDGFRGGIRLLLTAFLQSPWFLYRVEQSALASAGPAKLGGFELAARLSYLLTSSTPDAALLDAAQSGALDSDTELLAHAERLLASPGGSSAVAGFHEEWLKVSGIGDLEKDATQFPTFNDQLKQAIAAETTHFVDYLLKQGDGRFSTMLTAPFSVIDPILAPLYGVTPPGGVARVDFPAGQRSGLLTQAAFLSMKAHERETSPVRRGVGLLQSLVCISLPPPPPDVMAQVPAVDPNATTRERFALHSQSPACAACHDKIDPAGFAFESYDALGAYRTTENGKAIETSVEVVNVAADVNGAYPNVASLLARLAASQTASDCYTVQWFRYALKREPLARDACSLQRMLTAFRASQGGIRDLVLAAASSDAFRYAARETP
jgi:hypothetical protein